MMRAAMRLLLVTMLACGTRDSLRTTSAPPSCSQVWDHVVELAPAELRGNFAAARDREIASCEHELTDPERRCSVAALSIEALERCKVHRSPTATASPWAVRPWASGRPA